MHINLGGGHNVVLDRAEEESQQPSIEDIDDCHKTEGCCKADNEEAGGGSACFFVIFFTYSPACDDSSACCECGEYIEEKDEDHIDKRNARDSRVSLRRNHDGIGDAHESSEELLDDERKDECPEGFIAEAQLKLGFALVFAEVFFKKRF